MADATGYGRVVREEGRPVGIVEHRDATEAQRQIREIGTSVYCFDAARFWPALAQVTPENEQSEYYLTDVIGILHRQGQRLEAVITEDPSECLGVNDRKQLAELAGDHAAAHPGPAHGRRRDRHRSRHHLRGRHRRRSAPTPCCIRA